MMLSLLVVMVCFLIFDILASPYSSLSMNFIKQLSQVSIMGLFIAELAMIAGSTSALNGIANFFVVGPYVVFYFFVALEFKRRIFCKSTK
jgi:hypothetical protein